MNGKVRRHVLIGVLGGLIARYRRVHHLGAFPIMSLELRRRSEMSE